MLYHVARVPKPNENRISAVLVPRAMGYLIVGIYFHRIPVMGLDVEFRTFSQGEMGDRVGVTVRSDGRGIALVDRLVPAAEYVCQIENQLSTVVTTVHHLYESYPLVLPIGRPYVDVDEDQEFGPRW